MHPTATYKLREKLSMSEKKPKALNPVRARNCCPICGKVSYSRAGVHPQCSVRQADKERTMRMARERLLEEQERTSTAAKGDSHG
jgi:hypothetical protein